SAAMQSALHSAREEGSGPSLPPSAQETESPFRSHRLLHTTREKNAWYIPYLLPAATPRRRVHPLHSASTPAQCRRPAPPPPVTTPAPRPLPGPSAIPPSNADSGSSVRARHSLPPKPDSTRCPAPEIPAAAHYGAMFAEC